VNRTLFSSSAVGGCAVRPTGAIHSEIKFAVREISGELRKANDKIRCTCVYPSVVESDLAKMTSQSFANERMRSDRKLAFQPEAIARAIQFVIEQPYDADVNEIRVRPLAAHI
jgi:NADP-dependent 3-hydroxy acid dehydrogenase YdfG